MKEAVHLKSITQRVLSDVDYMDLLVSKPNSNMASLISIFQLLFQHGLINQPVAQIISKHINLIYSADSADLSENIKLCKFLAETS